jgi:hypothetical protein
LCTSPKVEPPRFAEFLVSACVKKRYKKALLSDLDENFQRDLVSGMTPMRARIRYCGAALHSIGPQLWAMAKRIGIGLIGALADRILH